MNFAKRLKHQMTSKTKPNYILSLLFLYFNITTTTMRKLKREKKRTEDARL